MPEPATHFQIDKRVPVALIVTLLLQTGAAVWWASGMSAAQEQNIIDQKRIESRVERIESARDDDRRTANDLNARVIRIEEKLIGQTEKLDDQAETLQRILRSVERAPGGAAR